MSEAAAKIDTHAGHGHGDPHLAHHFDSPLQQYSSAKLGMWVFLGTEILMFGGLFCAYSVYRHNHPEVFEFAHKALNPVLGGINTVVLIASSLTMAMAVRYSQLGQRVPLLVCIFLTFLGGLGFMGIKTIEYRTKWEHHLFPGRMNVYNKEYKGQVKPPNDLLALEHEAAEPAPVEMGMKAPGETHMSTVGAARNAAEPIASTGPASAPTTAPVISKSPYVDPLLGTPDEPRIKPTFVYPEGLSPSQVAPEAHLVYAELTPLDQQRVNAFFSVYFLMTGLHGFHVLVGMALMIWIFIRAKNNEFSPRYFTPVDLVGLYWHLVDLIWIFLFPLLYLIR